ARCTPTTAPRTRRIARPKPAVRSRPSEAGRPKPAALSAYRDHRAVARGGEHVHPGVSGVLPGHGRRDERAEVVVARPGAHPIAEADLLRTEEAHLEVAVGREAETVAART